MSNTPIRAAADALAETARTAMRMHLLDRGIPTARRIQALMLHCDGAFTRVETGAELPDGDPVPAILEYAGAEVFLVCTPEEMARERLPYVIGLDDKGRVVEG